MRDRESLVGGGLIALASLQFGIVVVVGTQLLRGGLSVTAMLAIRFAVAGAVLLMIQAGRRKPLLPAAGERLWLALLGLAGYAVEAALFFAAIRYGTATAVTLLFFTYPVLVALISMAIGRGTPGRLVAGAMAAAIAGAAIVVAAGGAVAIRPAGIALALASAVMFAAYLTGVDHVMRRTPPLTASAWVAIWASIGLFASLTIGSGRHAPGPAEEWIRVAIMGLATGGAFVCLMAGLRMLGPVRTSVVAALEPLSSAILATIVLDEPLSAATAAGGLLILGGATTASLARREPVEVTESEIP
ncbi:MAG TPA: DMT family transporter [Actinomycetota bacterium]|nr:DMT family transporter [Actinomycetota bacterium]